MTQLLRWTAMQINRNKVSGFCPSGTACWTNNGHTCCDCHCGDLYGRSWYCCCG